MALPTPVPVVNPETEQFWAATGRGELLLPRCNSCTSLIWYPRSRCPSCGQTGVTWERASGRGTIYSFTISRRGQGPYADAAPYVLAYVELEEGPRLLTNIVNCEPFEVSVAQAVRLVFHDTGQGRALLRFCPDGTGS